MVHLYTGDGKGKTTCAMGLALRAAGRGMRVVIAQFLKGEGSGERLAFEKFPNVTLIFVPERMKFVSAMNGAEKAEAAARARELLGTAARLSASCDMLVLDEVCGAVTEGLIPLEAVLRLLDDRPETLEVVMTGREPAPELIARAHYLTEMKKRKHPFDEGASARAGIEF